LEGFTWKKEPIHPSILAVAIYISINVPEALKL
jgi:hypothetical protein